MAQKNLFLLRVINSISMMRSWQFLLDLPKKSNQFLSKIQLLILLNNLKKSKKKVKLPLDQDCLPLLG